MAKLAAIVFEQVADASWMSRLRRMPRGFLLGAQRLGPQGGDGLEAHEPSRMAMVDCR